MANLCSFKMCLRGGKENIQKFFDAMSQKDTLYMGRGADAELEFEDDDYAFITGCCKWSVKAAMVRNAISMRTEPEKWAFSKGVDKNTLEFITLFEAAARFKLEIEVYSEEGSNGFMEHIVIDKDKVLKDETVEFFEYFLDDEDEYLNKKDAESKIGISISDEDWEEGYLRVGGFDWDFTI